MARAFALASSKDEGPEASSRHRANHWPGAMLMTQATALVVAAPLTMRGRYVGAFAVRQLEGDLVHSLKAEVGFLR
jgi:hypothetical protein